MELEFALKWNSFIDLETIHLNHEAKKQSLPLDDTWSTSFTNVITHFKQCIQDIANGTATFQIIKLFYDNLKDAFKFAEFLVNNNLKGQPVFLFNKLNMSVFNALIHVRMKECNEFERYRTNLKAFVQFCNIFKQVNVKVYEKQLVALEKLVNFDKETKINNLCTILNFEHDIVGFFSRIPSEKLPGQMAEWFPKITHFFNISQSNMPVIDEIINLDRSCCVILDSYFSISCDNIKNMHAVNNKDIKDLNIEQVLNEVWPMTRLKWQKDTEKIEKGRIKLVELDEMLKTYFKENYPKMEKELIYMNSYFSISNLKERNEQIRYLI